MLTTLLLLIFIFGVVVYLPYLIDQYEHFMPKLDTLQRHKQLEEVEKKRYQAEKEARWAAKDNPHPPKTVEIKNNRNQLNMLYDKIGIQPGVDIPIPHDFFSEMSDDEHTQLKFDRAF